MAQLCGIGKMGPEATNRVLVVDDEVIIRAFLSDGLADAGYHVLTARNGAEALDRIQRDQPHAVLLDLLMPVMDGLTFLRERLGQPHLAALPVVVFSAAGMEPLRKALALRATAVLSKPLDLDVLSTVLDHVLRDARFPSPAIRARQPDAETVGTCPICGTTTYATIGEALPTLERIQAIQAARREHVLSHTAADIARVPLRTRLLEMPLGRRRILSDWVYRELRHEWGDRDCRGVYSIDEALDSAVVHRLWQAASSCGYKNCQHFA
jgi:CheY-like chemotaxis protein